MDLLLIGWLAKLLMQVLNVGFDPHQDTNSIRWNVNLERVFSAQRGNARRDLNRLNWVRKISFFLIFLIFKRFNLHAVHRRIFRESELAISPFKARTTILTNIPAHLYVCVLSVFFLISQILKLLSHFTLRNF